MPSSSRPPKPGSPSQPDAVLAPVPPVIAGAGTAGRAGLGVAVVQGGGGVITARQAGGLIDLKMDVDPIRAGTNAALQHLAKAINIAFQTNFSENELEAAYQAAVVLRGEIRIIHREYFGFGPTWIGQFGRLLRSIGLTFEGPDPASPEGRKRYEEKGAASIRGVLNLLGRKLDLVSEYEDKVPAYVEQLLDRLESSGMIVGWNRDHWDIWTTQIGLDVRIAPKTPGEV